MTLSIEVLPAPFGPMMARISPFLTSKEMSVIAFTPPKDSETFLTSISNPPGAMPSSGAAICTGSGVHVHSAASRSGWPAAG